MARKRVFAKSGYSLADVYDVKGTVVGIDELLTTEVQAVHEMGGTIFSERMSAQVFRAVSGDVLQSTAYECLMDDTLLPPFPCRLHGVTVLTDTTTRLTNAAVMVRDEVRGREMPIWVWDQTNEVTVRMVDGTLQNLLALTPISAFYQLPTMLTGTSQMPGVAQLVCRGTTSAFGAGDVEVTLLAHISFAADIDGLNSRGLPVPSW